MTRLHRPLGRRRRRFPSLPPPLSLSLSPAGGRACALAYRHFRLPPVPVAGLVSGPQLRRVAPALSPCPPYRQEFCFASAAGGQPPFPLLPPPCLGAGARPEPCAAAMPAAAAAAAPLISSVQKLVLYETRAVSSVCPPPPPPPRRCYRGPGRSPA